MSPISVIESPEVLEARIAWPGVAASRSAKAWCLIAIFSGTASITKSTSPKPSYSVVPVISPTVCSTCASASSWVSFSRLTSLAAWPWLTSRAFSRPLSTNSGSTSLRRTGMSAAATTWAISPPITPAPTTAALKTNMAREPRQRPTSRASRRALRFSGPLKTSRSSAARSNGDIVKEPSERRHSGAIVLDSATDCAGWCGPGVVAVCAWSHDLWEWWPAAMVDQHRHILDLLAVERVPIETSREHREFMEELGALGVRLRPGARAGDFELRWTEDQARAYQLLHILPHELGHHYDRITSRKGRRAGRGEPYAEAYANRVLEEIWPAYLRAFRV